jgi:hypothetical protein
MESLKDWLAVIGGVGVVIIGVGKLASSLIQEGFKSRLGRKAKEAESQLGYERIQPDLYAKDQYEICKTLWSNLQGLKLMGDLLWEEVSQSGIEAFGKALEELTTSVEKWSIFFEPEDYKDLKRLLHEFWNYGDGKNRLNDLHLTARSNHFFIPQVQEQIDNNRASKEDYEQLLKRIEKSFRMRFARSKYAA